MADRGPGSTGRSKQKRLARAKVKPTDNGIKSSKGAAQRQQPEPEPTKAEKRETRKKRLTSIGIGIFAVIMALSMMLPSLSYIFGSNDQQPVEQEEQASDTAADEQEDAEASDDEADEADEGDDAEVEEPSQVETVDANYKAVVDGLEAKLAENKKDLPTLLNLGGDYLDWANEASMYATTEEEQEHVAELYDKAMEYYDAYLKLNDSTVVKVNRALCQIYSGSVDEGIAALEKITKDVPDCGPAWMNLGRIYEALGQTDDAKDAYQKAIETDPDDAYGAKSSANSRLAAMAASENKELTNEEDTAAAEEADTGAAALENALKANSDQ